MAGPDTKSTSTAAESTRIAYAGTAYLGDAIFANGSGADVYLLVFDRATALAGGEVPLGGQIVPNGTTAGLSFNRLPMNTGIVVAASSTLLTYTAVGAGAGLFIVSYTAR